MKNRVVALSPKLIGNPPVALRHVWLLVVCAGMVCVPSCHRRNTPGTDSPIAQSPDDEMQMQFRQAPGLEWVRYSNGRDAGLNSILEIVGGGVACFDYDLDGQLDLLFPGGGEIRPDDRAVTGVPSMLAKGNAQWAFADVSSSARIPTAEIYSHGAFVSDYDNDGFSDVLISGYQGVRLWRNQGDGTFRDVTAGSGLENAPWTTAAAWADFDHDGTLDLYLTSYVQWDFDSHVACDAPDGLPDVCSPNSFAASRDIAFVNRGNGQFSNVSDAFAVSRLGKGLGALAADLNRDGRTDLYVANDATPNFLFWQVDKMLFEQAGFESGVAVDDLGAANGSMGIALLDFNLDGHFDLLVTNFEHEDIALYEGEGDKLFRHASRDAGLRAIEEGVVGFGVIACDFDCDGDEDLLLTSGHVHYRPDAGSIEQPPLLFENETGHRFQLRETKCQYLSGRHVGRGLAAGDVDNDGDLDAVVTHLSEAPALLENVRDNDHSWLRLQLIGRTSNRDAIGTTVTVTIAGKSMVRQRVSGGSYLSSSQGDLFWGWEGTAAATVRVQWPNGTTTELESVAPSQKLTLIEPFPSLP